ncbi:uncharacterized protein LOC109728152 [Ananas comosus]|uniref:glucan endo-1,3-beta-D-glucosidase n=1 Tax=Ananas comosus TaxID=4615 RepID=A0A6P5HKW2_ANACO|nr:uncharacterized protein LOC109728152 [Ananas comosus]
MAIVAPSSPVTLDSKPEKSDSENPPSSSAPSAPIENPNPNPVNPNPNPVVAPPPPAVPSFAPSFRPLGAPHVPQYSPVPNPSYPMAPNPSIQPPGVAAMPPGAAAGGVGVAAVRPVGMYAVAPGQPPVHYGQVPNGYMAVPPQPGVIPPPGVPRYPGPYPAMMRPGFPPRPIPSVGVIPQLPRPPVPGIRGVPPIVTPSVRPVVPIVAPAEKPQTTVYVGKISPSVDNEFLLSLLRLCGPVKSWKRAQDPSTGTLKGFGFCEFESAEGILRALRLLSKLNIDGQELVLNINQATREYLEKYVEKKTEREKEKMKENESGGGDKESESISGSRKELLKPATEEAKKDSEDSSDKENQEDSQKFGVVTDEDREADRDAVEKISDMIEERLKTNPLPPPPPVPPPADGLAKSQSELASRSRDGDSEVDVMKSDAAEEKNDEETTSENKAATESDKPGVSSPDRNRSDRSKEREKEREKREKERELERYERDRERERVRREREREQKQRESERLYRERLKEWEAREREKEYHRQHEREREKDKERERRREVLRQEDESDDDDSRKRRRRSSTLEDKKRKRQREREDDAADRLREEEEIAEAKRRAVEEQPKEVELKPSVVVEMECENPIIPEEREDAEGKQVASDQNCEVVSTNGDVNVGDGIHRNSNGDELNMQSDQAPDLKQNTNGPTKKLGFGLIGSGKRTNVPSVFHQEDDEDVEEKKMRPLIPIDYSTEELQAVQSNASGAPPNIAAAAEYAKRISSANPKEEKHEIEKDRSRRSSERSSHRDRDRNDDEGKERMHEKMYDREKDREEKPKTENKKLLDAKQLIDMIPKTKEELFVYEINWAIYDKLELHERMRPWISKKITEFLGEEEATLVDYIVSCTKDHVQASKMLELLQSILDDEAEMFVLKMWRMLIFEIKKVETGLAAKRISYYHLERVALKGLLLQLELETLQHTSLECNVGLKPPVMVKLMGQISLPSPRVRTDFLHVLKVKDGSKWSKYVQLRTMAKNDKQSRRRRRRQQQTETQIPIQTPSSSARPPPSIPPIPASISSTTMTHRHDGHKPFLFPGVQSTVLPDPSPLFSPQLLSSPLPTNSFFQNFALKNGDQPEYIHPYLIKSSSSSLSLSFPSRFATPSFIYQTFVPDLTVSSPSASDANPKSHLISSFDDHASFTKHRFELNSGQTFLCYSSAPLRLAPSGVSLLTAPAFSGVVRLAFLPDPSYEPVLDRFSSCYPVSGAASLARPFCVEYNWAKEGWGELLLLAHPLHLRLLDRACGVTVLEDFKYRSIDGDLVGVVADSWVLRTDPVSPTWHSMKGVSEDGFAEIASALCKDADGLCSALIATTSSYFYGKAVARAARLALIAEEVGFPDVIPAVRQFLKASVTPWLDGSFGGNAFLYDHKWGGLVTKQGSVDSGADFGFGIFNDHHYHLGYFIYAIAVLSKLDPSWGRKYMSHAYSMVADFMTLSRKQDASYARLRCFDLWKLHSWAGGLTEFADGRNQESTSEAVNAYYSAALLGLSFGDTHLVSIGSTLAAFEILAAQTWWHVREGEGMYEDDFSRENRVVGVLWANKRDSGLWFAPPEWKECRLGIQVLPLLPITEVLFQDVAFVRELVKWALPALAREGVGEGWKGFVYAMEGVYDKESAMEKTRALSGFDDGNSLSNMLWWLYSRGEDVEGVIGWVRCCWYRHYCH